MSRHEFDPDYVVPTSEVLRHWLQMNHFSPRAAVAGRYSGDAKHWAAMILHSVLADELVTPAIADVLAAATGIPNVFWLNFEHNYRTGLLAGKKSYGGEL